jgi:hypothetical protein
MSLTRTILLLTVLALCAVPAALLTGCSGGDGPPGIQGAVGDAGDSGVGIVPVHVLDVFGTPLSAAVSVHAHVKSYSNPPDYVATPMQVAPQATGDFELHLPPGTYDIWASVNVGGADFYDSTQGVSLNYVISTYGTNPALTLRVPTAQSPAEFSMVNSGGAGGVLDAVGDYAWWKWHPAADPLLNQTWIWSTLAVNSGTPLVTMRNCWLQASNDFGTQGSPFTYAVNSDRAGFLMSARLPSRSGSDVATSVDVRVDAINGQPGITPIFAGVVLLQTTGTLHQGQLWP